MQLFILLYIEAGSYISEDEDPWEFFVLFVSLFSSITLFLTAYGRYEKRTRSTSPDISTYHFIGYSSLYPFYHFPDKVRMRLR
jgi:histone acetyltransferase 1